MLSDQVDLEDRLSWVSSFYNNGLELVAVGVVGRVELPSLHCGSPSLSLPSLDLILFSIVKL